MGEGAILVGTFDLHGNEDAAFLDHADMAFAVKYFPHYDGHLQGQRAARMLVRAVRGEFRPAHRTFKVPILSPTVVQWTGAAPWSDLVQRALVWEAREPDVYVNVYFGFPWGDAPDAGMTVQAITNDDPALAERVARDVAEFAWRRRRALLEATRIHTIADGVRLARAAVAEGAAPVVLADHSDRSGRATWLLREILRQGLTRTLVATVASPDIAAGPSRPATRSTRRSAAAAATRPRAIRCGSPEPCCAWSRRRSRASPAAAAAVHGSASRSGPATSSC